MTDSIDAEPLLELSRRRPPAARSAAPLDDRTTELDISALPEITSDDGLVLLPDSDPGSPGARRGEPPPPPSSRRRAPHRPAELAANLVGGAAAGGGGSAAPARPLITVPKRWPALRAPLPSVIAPRPTDPGGPRYLGATLPPLDRRADHSEPRELLAESSPSHPEPPLPSEDESAGPATQAPGGRARRQRVAAVVGIVALGAVTATAGAILHRGRSAAPAPPPPATASVPAADLAPSEPAFLVAAPPAAEAASAAPPAPPDDPPPVPSEQASTLSPSPETATSPGAPAPATAAAMPPPSVDPAASTPEAPPTMPPTPSAEGAAPPLEGGAENMGAVGKGIAPNFDGASAEPSATRDGAPEVERRAPVLAPNGTPADAASIDPITTYTFSGDRLFAVTAAPRRMTDLILQPGEKLVTHPTAGDAALWVITVVDGVHNAEPQQHVQVKPLRPGSVTNLTLTTTRRNYHLELTSSTHGAYMAAVEWTYPEDEAARRRAERARAALEHLSTVQIADVKNLSFDYAVRVTSGEPGWKPTRVFDDGKQTFIRFPARIVPEHAPLLFVMRSGNNRAAQYVNYRISGDVYVIDRLIDTAELRLPASDDDDPDQVVRITRRMP